ncbi:hypothetical protein [Pseudomonas citronellolis]|uniref:hypothetical protein n=1 Tax=Pseudomonas citronellolis TaxID=53408 RepID=UPI00248F2322|nr:hypothetical protein [Pseudomonas citronellolis]
MQGNASRWEEFKVLYQTPSEAALLNALAVRSFRNTGDQDYIAARMAMRAMLPVQFLWSGLQAVEKYLKCILLLNKISSKGVGHDLDKALALVNDSLPFNITLSKDERQVFEHLAASKGDRYLVMSLHLFDWELPGLDSLVWRLRQYCEPLDVVHYNDSPSRELLEKNAAVINARLARGVKPEEGYIAHGLLEDILFNESSRAHEPLVWRNEMFGGNEPIKCPADGVGNFSAINSPLYLHPENVRAVSELIVLPKEKQTIKEFEALAAERRAAKKQS